jgi:hypothetical protein
MLPAIGEAAPKPSAPEQIVAMKKRMTHRMGDLPERPAWQTQWNSSQMTMRTGMGTPNSHNKP